MHPGIRRRLPPSVRRLLTDIGPKQDDWHTDTEPAPDSVSRDGLLLPARGAGAGGQEELLSPAKTQDAGTSSSSSRVAVCMLCERGPSRYTCPRCNLQYCGLVCYRSPDHSACSEQFYKEAVLRELKEPGNTEMQARRKMREILIGLREKAQRSDGGMEGALRDAGVVGGGTGGGGGGGGDGGRDGGGEAAQVVELLSRLAELQQSGGGNLTEAEAILKQLDEIGAGQEGEEEEEEVEHVDLAQRLSGLHIDELSEEELWDLLDSRDKEKFLGLVKGGVLGGLITVWKPWWEEHEDGGGPLVEVLEEERSKLERGSSASAGVQDLKNEAEPSAEAAGENKGRDEKDEGGGRSSGSSVPKVSAKIPKLSSLCRNPSPLVCHSLVNALFGYTFTLCRFNGDAESLMFEFCDMVLALSEALSSSRVFTSTQEALDRGEALILEGGYLDKEDAGAPARAVEAVAHILSGRAREDAAGYCLAALSQLRSLLGQARAATSKEDAPRRQKYFLAGKKCEFLQAWVLESSHRGRLLAVAVWEEHGRRESERQRMEEAKSVVEESVRRGRRTEGLIQELG